MKKFVFLLLIFCLYFLPSFVNAQNLGIPRIPDLSIYTNLSDLLNVVASLLRPIFVLTLGALILYGAWLWLTSQGDDSKIKKARQIIVAGIIGFSIAVFAPTILNFVLDALGVDTVGIF